MSEEISAARTFSQRYEPTAIDLRAETSAPRELPLPFLERELRSLAQKLATDLT